MKDRPKNFRNGPAALIDFLKMAKDYQILIFTPTDPNNYLIKNATARKWGFLASHAPGGKQLSQRDMLRVCWKRLFVEVSDIAPMVQCLQDLNDGEFEEHELFPNGTYLEDLKPLQDMFDEVVKRIEEFWAASEDELKLSSQSRYGRVPKFGNVVSFYMTRTGL